MKTELKILLVDDDDIDIMAFKRALKKVDVPYSFSSCNYANEALDLLSSNQFDCVFIDYQLPGTNGLELLKKIKHKEPEQICTIITSQGDEGIAVEMMKSGAFDYFTKAEVGSEKIRKTIHSISNRIRIEKEKEKAKAELKEKEEFIKRIVLSSPNIIYVNDIKNGKNIYHSPETLNILGYNQQDIKEFGNDLFNILVDGDDYYKFIDHQRNMVYNAVDGDVFEIEFRLKHKNGNWLWFLARDTPFKRDPEGNLTEVLGTAIDITERRRFEAELVEAKKAAEMAAVTKADFLSNMSHEIRTPMNAIIGLTKILLRNDYSKNDVENLKAIKHSADNLLVIVNDVLDFSKIEAGKLKIEKIDFNLEEQLNLIKKTFLFKTRQKGLKFSVYQDENLPKVVKGDPFRLNQILVNLIGNAIKFTNEGKITLNVSLAEIEKGKTFIRFDISDTGIGIKQEDLKKIFENFSQASTATSRKFGGTGLGLAISKQLSQLLNGKLQVDSTLGKGSTFSVTIPFCKGDESKVLAEAKIEKVDYSEIEGANILVAEDNPFNQLLIKQHLLNWKTNFTVVDNGLEVLEELSKNNFDIVLMDIQMPEMDGFEATEKIRNTGAIKNLPVVALTADVLKETEKKIIECGFNDYITKPMDEADLYQKIKKILIPGVPLNK